MTYLEALKEKFPDCKDCSRTIEDGKCVEYRHPPICRASADYCELCWNEEIKENEGSVTVDTKIGWCKNILEEEKQ